jgi:hypothetical protein
MVSVDPSPLVSPLVFEYGSFASALAQYKILSRVVSASAFFHPSIVISMWFSVHLIDPVVVRM